MGHRGPGGLHGGQGRVHPDSEGAPGCVQTCPAARLRLWQTTTLSISAADGPLRPLPARSRSSHLTPRRLSGPFPTASRSRHGRGRGRRPGGVRGVGRDPVRGAVWPSLSASPALYAARLVEMADVITAEMGSPTSFSQLAQSPGSLDDAQRLHRGGQGLPVGGDPPGCLRLRGHRAPRAGRAWWPPSSRGTSRSS